MSRINTNVNSLIAQRVLGQNQMSLQKSLERLSTGLAINRGSDNPAGLIASEKLRSDTTKLEAALSNAERADQVSNIAEGGLQEISGLLIELQSLVSEVGSEAGISDEEREANQLQIDGILQTIDRIANTTSFAGTKLLNGSFDFRVSGVNGSVEDFSVQGAKVDGSNVAVQAVITQSAQHGGLYISAGAAALNLTAASSTFSFELAGVKGSKEFSFSSGTTLANIASTINTFKDVTGVSAVASGNIIEFKSTEFGSDEFVSFNLTNVGGQAGSVFFASGGNENSYTTTGATAFAAVTNVVRDDGQDIGALVNGIQARGKGKEIVVDNEALSVNLTLSNGLSQTVGAVNAFTITGGGAKFNLGPDINATNQVRLGIKNVATRNLGNSSLGFLSSLGSGGDNNVVNGDVTSAQRIVDKAVDQITGLRGRIGAFQKNVVGATIRSLGVAIENTKAAESAIRDTDFAKETSELTRSQILVAASNQALAIAKSVPQNVLGLLG